VQSAHAFGGFDIDGVLFFKRGGLIASDEAEQADIFVKFFEVTYCFDV